MDKGEEGSFFVQLYSIQLCNKEIRNFYINEISSRVNCKIYQLLIN